MSGAGRARLLAALVCVGVFGCATSPLNDDGDAAGGSPNVDGGANDGLGTPADVVVPTDALRDTGPRPDGAPPADGGDGGAPMMDGGPPPMDSGPPVDSGPPPVDSGPPPMDSGSSCVTVSIPSGGSPDASCPGPVSGTCAPGDVSGYVPQWHAPAQQKGACTSTEITDFYANCLGSNSSQSACNTWTSGHGTCFGCLLTDESVAGGWGPLVSTDMQAIIWINGGGCIDLLEPCNLACAKAAQEELIGCDNYACEQNCDPTFDPNFGSDYNACIATADSCGCYAYSTAAGCVNAITGPSHPASVCWSATASFDTLYHQVAPVFCGP